MIRIGDILFRMMPAAVIAAAAFMPVYAEDSAQGKHYVGGDISLLPEYEAAGAKYKTHDGRPIAELLPWLSEQGMNAMRVRLFVNPADYTEEDADPNACQTMDYILPLCQRIKAQGMALMLDFHYSDTWADPGKQWIPKAWQNLSEEELPGKVYDYTRESLATLKAAGVTPDFIQTGNEISYGMLWGKPGDSDADLYKTFNGSNKNWDRLANLLKEAGRACREECPEAGIVLHTERVKSSNELHNFYRQMNRLGVEYDIIGLSYYPYFHGNMATLDKALTLLEKSWPDKQIMIVETGYAYKWEVPGTSEKVDYPYSDAGQNEFAKALVATLEKHPAVDGLFWWWMEYNAYGTKLSNWYNAPLFDSTNGRACSALTTICSFASANSGILSIPYDAFRPKATKDILYDLQGRPLTSPAPGQPYISNGHLQINK